MAVERELAMLAGRGPVGSWIRSTDALVGGGLPGRLRAAAELLGPPGRCADFTRRLAGERPTVVHAHNLWPFFGADLHRAAARLGIPTVQTLHNFRLVAGAGRFLGPHARPARDDADRAMLAGMTGLYPSRLQEHLYAFAIQRAWDAGLAETVSAWLCVSSFQRRIMIDAGLPAERIVVKPNAVPDDIAPGDGGDGHAVFVGRLGAEKGVLELAAAWPASGLPPLAMVGDGPLAGALATMPGVRPLGRRAPDETRRLIAGARFLVMNSQCFEGLPLVLLEALAAGTPVLVPRLGGMPEVTGGGRFGATFAAGDPEDLAHRAAHLWQEAPGLRAACRARYLEAYAVGPVLDRQMAIYRNLAAGRLPGEGLA